MKRKKIVRVEKLTDQKWLNLYNIYYENGVCWTMASRGEVTVESINAEPKADVVQILPHFKKDGEDFVVLIKEFRYTINRWVYDLPAGLLSGKSIEETVKEELWQEIGAKLLSFEQLKNGYSSVGMTDEHMADIAAEISFELCEQHLEDCEEIERVVIKTCDIPEFLKKDNYITRAATLLLMFYYEKQKNKN